MELSIYYDIRIPLEGLDREHITQMCQWRETQRESGADRRNDWVWVKQCPWRCDDAVNGRLLWLLQRVLKITLQNMDAAVVEYILALTLTTIPENSGNLDPVSEFVQVRNAPAAIVFLLFRVGNIVGCALVSPEIAATSMAGHGQTKRWIVNSPIDLATWNDVYN